MYIRTGKKVEKFSGGEGALYTWDQFRVANVNCVTLPLAPICVPLWCIAL